MATESMSAVPGLTHSPPDVYPGSEVRAGRLLLSTPIEELMSGVHTPASTKRTRGSDLRQHHESTSDFGSTALASRDAFCAVKQNRRADFERLGDPKDVCERNVPLAALDGTEVGAVQAALQRKGFLGDALLLADGTDRVAECDVCWRESGDGGSFPACCTEVHGR